MTSVLRTSGLALAAVALVAVVASALTLTASPRGASAGVPAAGTLYGTAYQGPTGPSTLYTIDPTTGVATEVGPIGFARCGGMDFDSGGTLYATCQVPANGGAGDAGASGINGGGSGVLITIDPSTGTGTEVGPLNKSEGVFDVSFRNSDDTLFYTAHGENKGPCVALGTIDTTSGAATELGDTQTCDPGNGIAFSAADTLYHTNAAPELNTLNQSTGEATQVAAHTFDECAVANGVSSSGKLGGDRINAMEFQPGSGALFASHNAGEGGGGPNCLSTVNTTTGDVTVVGPSVNGLDALAFALETSADLDVTKTAGPSQVDVGEDLTYTITVTNNGPATATNVVATDDLPGNVEFVSVEATQGTCSESDGTVTCELGSLDAGETATIEIVVNPTEEGDLENTATASADQSDPDSDNNAAVAAFAVGPEPQQPTATPTPTATPSELPETGSPPADGGGFPWLAVIAGSAALTGAGVWWLARVRVRPSGQSRVR